MTRYIHVSSFRGLLLCVLLVTVGSLGCTGTGSSSAPTPSTSTAPGADTGQVADDGSLSAEKRALVAEKRAEGLEPNRLIHSNSPYLLQHAFNPVDWHVWGEAAFEKARREDKPVFLSVGYSTCYWCHVMERKVFSDDGIAAVLNEHAVPVKVDREERPDVDRIYMQALQMMRGGGGWPMSMFLTPDLEPFFGATYIPPEGRGGQPGFPGVVRQIHEAWTGDRERVERRADQIVQALQQRLAAAFEPTPVGADVVDQGFTAFEERYDPTYGGFGEAPKFPRPATPRFLLHYYGLADSDRALEMTEHTLRAMARGGMYDHLGEGFHRYSTDERWHVPHFEKMLYDQALLAQVYLQAHAITGDDFYAGVARDVLAFVDREMTRPEGGFYSALNAESLPHEDAEEPEEGAYYVWTAAEIEERLPGRQARVFSHVYGVEEEGNVQRDPHDVFTGKNVLYRAHTVEEAAERFDASPDEVRALLREAEETLFEARQERIEPSLDDKSVTAWNGMMISAYARAHELLGDEPYRRTAVRATEFLLEHVHDDSSGRLSRRYRNGEAAHEANMEDYAYLAGGLIALYRATGTEHWLDEAIRLTDRQIELFYDEENGGFFDTTGEDPSLIVRTKEFYGGARPAGNAVALTNLVELATITGAARHRRRAEETLEYFGTVMQGSPAGVPEMLTALTKKLEAPELAASGRSRRSGPSRRASARAPGTEMTEEAGHR